MDNTTFIILLILITLLQLLFLDDIIDRIKKHIRKKRANRLRLEISINKFRRTVTFYYCKGNTSEQLKRYTYLPPFKIDKQYNDNLKEAEKLFLEKVEEDKTISKINKTNQKCQKIINN